MRVKFNKTTKYLYIGSFEIKPREIIICFSIIALMALFGLFLKITIVEAMIESNNIYYRAVQINNEPKVFKQAIDTEVGNALVYGTVKASPPVTIPEVKGEYMYIKKIYEHYTRHIRTVSYTDSDGNRKTRNEIYYSWDLIGTDEKKSDKIEFLGMTFNNTISGIPIKRLDLSEVYAPESDGELRWDNYVYTSNHDRWYIEYIPKEVSGTIEGCLQRQGIRSFNGGKDDSIVIHPETKIEMFINDLKSSEHFTEVLFNIVWITTTVVIVVLFLLCENKWLDNKKHRRLQ